MADERRFTPAEYEAYTSAPQWVLDGFDLEAEYEAHWAREIRKWKQSHIDAFRPITEEWERAYDYIENIDQRRVDVFAPDSQIAKDRIPFALCSIMDVTATLFSNYPQPAFVSANEEQDQYAGALQQMVGMVLKANDFNALMFDVGLDTGCAAVGVVKAYVDYDESGPFGQEGRLVIQKIDPTLTYVDPKAKRLRWQDMQFIITENKLDIGAARQQFRAYSFKIDEWARCSTADQKDTRDGLHGHNIETPVANPLEGESRERTQIQILECWFKDERTKFVADMEAVPNQELIPDEDGLLQFNPDYKPGETGTYYRPKVDSDGYVVGAEVPAFPDGRCICLAGDRFIVADFANPFWHKRAPFTFFRGRPSKRLLTTGDLTNIIKIDRKLNDIYARVHTMAQAEIERPMTAEVNTFKTPRKLWNLSGRPDAIVVKNPGKEFGRLPFMEIPQFVFLYIQMLEKALERVQAIAGIMQGQLAEGAQLSAETVSNLQSLANAVLKMKAELIAEGMKELGYQLGWLVRQTYPENITIPVTKPDGSQIQVNWNNNDAAADYVVDIQSGSGLPGSHQQAPGYVLPLYSQGIIDRMAALQMLRIGQWRDIDERMRKQKLDDIQAQATGRALGLTMKQREKANDQPGRREKA